MTFHKESVLLTCVATYLATIKLNNIKWCDLFEILIVLHLLLFTGLTLSQ